VALRPFSPLSRSALACGALPLLQGWDRGGVRQLLPDRGAALVLRSAVLRVPHHEGPDYDGGAHQQDQAHEHQLDPLPPRSRFGKPVSP
jgi:hypothetical protein